MPLYPIDKDYAERMTGFDLEKFSVGVANCEECGHEFIHPVPTAVFLEAFYARYMSKAKEGFYRERAYAEIPGSFRDRYEPWLRKLAQLGIGNGRLLDVGAGLGMFLRLAQQHGFNVIGIEPNGEAAENLVRAFDIEVHNCLFEDAKLKGTVDVVTMWDLLEHLAHPRAALEKAWTLLSSEGVLVLEIPARDSLLHYVAKLLFQFTVGVVRRPLYLVCGVHHLHYFSEKDISRLLEDCGFHVLDVQRSETEFGSLCRRGVRGWRSIPSGVYNVGLRGMLFAARLLDMQNKLIVFAGKCS
ncbi:class I SAM-dependent methyltransferase [Nitrosococcus wardiae]|uniref:Class I SAM-dependent methyltransferase n=1 Tax=Nitrosococcus wardiae TaxID=1814290 RepID=A0A4P7C0K4_9GAMM|nr:class I SAM-dependent methyltransferase [Nitrosococcus wardiae]QBQ55961.1 class I SAM-dependent methyltransferase [Nitrosococcus wardiae]